MILGLGEITTLYVSKCKGKCALYYSYSSEVRNCRSIGSRVRSYPNARHSFFSKKAKDPLKGALLLIIMRAGNSNQLLSSPEIFLAACLDLLTPEPSKL